VVGSVLSGAGGSEWAWVINTKDKVQSAGTDVALNPTTIDGFEAVRAAVIFFPCGLADLYFAQIMVEEIHLILPTSCAHKTMAPLSEAFVSVRWIVQ